MIGKQIGRYRILEEVGRGGMGVVYRATQVTLNRTVALKMLFPHLARSSEYLSRFRREAEVLARLQHENIVHIYDVEEFEGSSCIVMEFVAGPSLGRVMRRDGRLPAATVRDVAVQVASGLAAAHRQGIVHRDIKPDNILFTVEGRAKLTDFGIARIADDGLGQTRAGVLLGTPFYMSPEQARGARVTGASDLYSLGVVLYEMLSGQVPFTGDDSIAVAVQHIHEPPPPIVRTAPGTPLALAAVVHRLLAKTVQERFASADELSQALRRLDLGRSDGVRGVTAESELPSGPRCPECRSELKSDFLTCPRCGLPIRKQCGNCGETFDPVSPECPFCHAPATPSPDAARRPSEPQEAAVVAARSETEAPPEPGSGGVAAVQEVARQVREGAAAAAAALADASIDGAKRVAEAAGRLRGPAARDASSGEAAVGPATLAARLRAAWDWLNAGEDPTIRRITVIGAILVAIGLGLALFQVFFANPRPQVSAYEYELSSGGADGGVRRGQTGMGTGTGVVDVRGADRDAPETTPDSEPESQEPSERTPTPDQPDGERTRPDRDPTRPDPDRTQPDRPERPETDREPATPAFDAAAARRTALAIVERQRVATERGDLSLLLSDIHPDLASRTEAEFRALASSWSAVQSTITNVQVDVAGPDRVLVDFHVVLTGTSRSGGRGRVVIVDTHVYWRLAEVDGRLLIVQATNRDHAAVQPGGGPAVAAGGALR